jgi:hypothetical protein
MRVMSMASQTQSSDGVSLLRGFMLFVGAAVLAAGVWWGYGSLVNWGTEPTGAPKCYWADRAYVPAKETMPLVGAPDQNGVPNNRRRVSPSTTDKVLAAEKVCKPGSCTLQAAKAYRSAFFWYFEPRLQHTRQLDKAYGDNGLRLARNIYSEPIDRQLEAGLRERYRAKAFRINGRRQNRDAIAILIFEGGAALRPCRKSDL